MVGFEAQRLTMVERQIRPNQVSDPRLLALMRRLPRERFVPPAVRALSYMDESLEVFPSVDGAAARYLLSPMVQARLIQLAEIGARDKVLDVGCVTGYSSAVLAGLAASVVGVEPESELAGAAKASLEELGIANVRIVSAPLAAGHPEAAPYDVILLNGSVPDVPDSLIEQLGEGGRLVAVITRAANIRQGKAYLFVKVGGKASGQAHFDAGAPRLPGFEAAPVFTF
ncbi:MAG: protein-L-isoaspartate O-methyltransferase family protein [Methyloceanibacter sp.]